MRRTNGNEDGMSSPFFLDFFLFFCSRPEPQVFRRPRTKQTERRGEMSKITQKRRKKTKRDEKVES